VPVHRAELAGRTVARRGRVRVYLDVSGSMDGVIRPLYAALASLAPWIEPEVQLFSTRVAGVPMARLRRGELVTTDGTDISVVTEHLVRERADRALIVTDGWVGRVPTEHAAALKHRRARIEAAVTHGGDPAFIEPLGGGFSRLPDLD
jgi:predicted metal-dependent peptidase